MDVRRLELADRDLLRGLRLRALADAPSAFGSSLAEEEAFTDVDWDARLGRADAATFVAVADDGTPVGLCAGVADRALPGTADLVGMWVAPEARRAGVGDVLVARVVAWAAAEGVEVLRLCVTEGNDGAERLYRRHGFVRTGCAEARTRDGLAEIGMERPLR